MKNIEVYDPPLCCPTGVCGPSVDPALTRFAANLDWLRKKGVVVTRFNLAQQPGNFVANSIVRAELAAKGNVCLPLLLVDGTIAAAGTYPDREELARICGVDYDPATDAASDNPAPFILPMADSGTCCPAPDNGPSIEADGDYCPWPKKEIGGCC